MLRSRSDSTRVLGQATGKDGAFTFAHVPLGAYVVEYSLVGHTSFRSPKFVVSEGSPALKLHTVALKQSVWVLDDLVVDSERSLFKNAIDRRVYNVDYDLMARSSTASDDLQLNYTLASTGPRAMRSRG